MCLIISNNRCDDGKEGEVEKEEDKKLLSVSKFFEAIKKKEKKKSNFFHPCRFSSLQFLFTQRDEYAR